MADKDRSEAGDEPQLTDFGIAVFEVIDSTSAGEVMTYGEVAAEAGKPGAARAVGTLLRNHGDGHPWWRIVASNGRLVPHNQSEHARLLADEGVVITDGRVRPVRD